MKRKILHVWHKIKGIPLIGVPYQKLIGNRKIARIAEKHNREIINNGMRYLRRIEGILSNSTIQFFLMSGSLLGIIRNGCLLKWDDDIDYGLIIKNGDDWLMLEKIMTDNGCVKIREFSFDGIVTEQTYSMDCITIDFFGVFPGCDDSYMLSYSYDRRHIVGDGKPNQSCVYETTLAYISGTKKYDAEGLIVTVPINAEEILSCIYNKDWRVPNPNWVSNSGDCCRWLKDKVGIQAIY